MRIVVWMLIVLSLAVVTSLHAISYIVPQDRELIGDAEAIFSAQAVASHAELTSDGRVVTIAELTVDEVLKGPIEPGTTLRLTEAGGIVGNDVVLAHFVSATAFRPIPLATRSDYLGSDLLRWRPPATTMVYCCGATPQPSPLDGVDAFNTALIRWNTAGAGISYTNGGRDDTATGGLNGFGRGNDHHNAGLFNDPFNDLPNPNGGFFTALGGAAGWASPGPRG